MGFGLLLIGYFTATMMALNTFGSVFRLIGYSIIVFAAKKLSQYDRNFFLLLASSAVMAVFSAVGALGDVSAFMYNNLLIAQPLISQDLSDALANVKILFDFVFTAILCYCIKSIASDTGAKKIVYTSVRNFVFFCIFCVLQFIVWLAAQMQYAPLSNFVKVTALPIWMVLINLICVILICVMIFSCYVNICDIDDVDMKVKPSRFEFVNRMRARRESKSDAYIKEAEGYANSRQSTSTKKRKKK